MSVTHAKVTGLPGDGTSVVQFPDWDADHVIADGSVTVAMVSASGTPSSSTFLRGDGSWSDGPAGPKGDTGATGPKGDKGDTGAQGPKGDTGSAGTTFAQFLALGTI